MENSSSNILIRQDRFLVDIEADCLKLIDNPERKLHFSQMESPARTGYYSFLYDPAVNQIYQPPPSLTRLPPEILYVEIPNKAFLDPVSISRTLGYSDQEIAPELIDQSLLEKDARIIPRTKFLSDEFFVDFRKLAFVDTLNLNNEISFEHAIESASGKIFVEYDLLNRKIPDPFDEDYIEETTAIIMLPPYPEMDPDGWKIIEQMSANPLMNSIQYLPRKTSQTIKPQPKRPILPTGRANKPGRRKG